MVKRAPPLLQGKVNIVDYTKLIIVGNLTRDAEVK